MKYLSIAFLVLIQAFVSLVLADCYKPTRTYPVSAADNAKPLRECEHIPPGYSGLRQHVRAFHVWNYDNKPQKLCPEVDALLQAESRKCKNKGSDQYGKIHYHNIEVLDLKLDYKS